MIFMIYTVISLSHINCFLKVGFSIWDSLVDIHNRDWMSKKKKQQQQDEQTSKIPYYGDQKPGFILELLQ